MSENAENPETPEAPNTPKNEDDDLEFNPNDIDLGNLGETMASDKPDTPQPTAAPTDSDDQTVEALQAQLQEMREQMMRALAEAENTRKRAIKERQDAGKFAIAGFARDMLEVADNLRRALEAVPEDAVQDNEPVKNLLDGIEATERTLLKGLENNKVKKIDPMDEIFDPNFHEVMFETPMPDKPAGTIIQVLEVGYVLNERLLRPARVGVVKDDGTNSAPPAEPGDNFDAEA